MAWRAKDAPRQRPPPSAQRLLSKPWVPGGSGMGAGYVWHPGPHFKRNQFFEACHAFQKPVVASALHHALPTTGAHGIAGKAAPNPLLLCSLIVAGVAWEPMTGPTVGLRGWATTCFEIMSRTWVLQAAQAAWGGGSRS